MGFVPLLRASTNNVQTLSREAPSIMPLWAPGCPSKVWLWGPLPHPSHRLRALPVSPPLGLGCPGLCADTAWRTRWDSACGPLRLLQGVLAVSLGQSWGLPRGPGLRFHRLQGWMRHGPPVLVLTPGGGHPSLGLRIPCK